MSPVRSTAEPRVGSQTWRAKVCPSPFSDKPTFNPHLDVLVCYYTCDGATININIHYTHYNSPEGLLPPCKEDVLISGGKDEFGSK
jgi:hypothetical protein